jgi:hypothetical protein
MKRECSILISEDALPQAALDQLGWEAVSLTAYVADRIHNGVEGTQVPVFVCVSKRPVAPD